MELLFDVKHQVISYDDKTNRVVEKSRNYLYAKFNFTSDWDGVIKTAVFVSAKGEAYNVILENDRCAIPWEVIGYPRFSVSVFGGDLITANKVAVYVMKSGYEEGEVPADPTPDVYTQILNSVKEPYIGDNGNWYIWDKDAGVYRNSGVSAQGPKGDTGETGPQGLQGPKGDTGDDGYTPVKGIDYWNDDDKAEIQSYIDTSIQSAILDSWEVAV